MAEPTTFIKVDRNILNWRWYTNSNTMRVFLHLLLTANIKKNGFMGVDIQRGQVATSYRHLATTLKLTYDEIRTAIQHLKDTGEITITRHPSFLVVTIVCYDEYQGVSPRQSPRKSQSLPNHSPITSQQSKNIRMEEEKKYIGSAISTPTTQQKRRKVIHRDPDTGEVSFVYADEQRDS